MKYIVQALGRGQFSPALNIIFQHTVKQYTKHIEVLLLLLSALLLGLSRDNLRDSNMCSQRRFLANHLAITSDGH